MMSCASMSKQSDGCKKSSSSSCYSPIIFPKASMIGSTLPKKTLSVYIVDDCQVDCTMRLFLPQPFDSYHDFTDWNVNYT